jgi:hypothetical protein
MEENAEMKEKLEKAGEKAVAQKKERQARAIKGAHLTEQIKKLIADSGLTAEDQTGFTKITGKAKGVKMYFALKGGRLDLNGFTIEAPGMTQISHEVAKEKHLGKVTAQVDFDASDADVLAAVTQALEFVKNAKDPEKPAKAPRVKKETETSAPAPAALEEGDRASA